MQERKTILVHFGKKKVEVGVDSVIYAVMNRNYAQIHISKTEAHKIRTTFPELQQLLGPDFIQVKRGCLVRVTEIQQISDRVYLKNGESLPMVKQQKQELVERVCAMRGCKPREILGKTTQGLSVERRPSVRFLEGSDKGELAMQGQGDCLMFLVGRREVRLPVDNILYIRMEKGFGYIHASSGEQYRVRTSHCALQRLLDDRLIFIGYNCLVSAMAIHTVGEQLVLCNGEQLPYSSRRRGEILRFTKDWKRRYIDSLPEDGIPKSFSEYQDYYRFFEKASFAFTDIEMVFDENEEAVDWIFRYGNEPLARLEKLPLSTLIGSSFGSLFSNMDPKWVRCYEQSVLYGKSLEITDYSPEIDTNLKVICFPTFKGHCGCILFNADELLEQKKL